jgi:large subunit ribosomal protein L11
MAKEISKVVKLQVKGGAESIATGWTCLSCWVNIMEFCKQFNARTQDKAGKICPVQITVYKDKSFEFVVKPACSCSVNGSCEAKTGSGA